jgi:hypothetical protein
MPDADLTGYTPQHRAELERLLGSRPWQEAIRSGLVDEAEAGRIEPGKTRNFIDTVVEQLLAFNERRARELIDRGCDDRQRLLDALSTWPSGLDGRDPVLSFVGLNVTTDCNLEPRCAYCNQTALEPAVDLAGWKRVVAEVTAGADGEGPYIYITGGEPLVLGTDVWGDELIRAGLAKLHVSLDTADRAVQDELRGGGSFDGTLRGICNVQLARALVGVSHPVIHTNCVLTRRNLELFADLFAFILSRHKQTADRDDPLFNDLFPHVVPVGGADNDGLRPSEAEFRRFYAEIWPHVCETWDRHQQELGIPKDERRVLFGYFSNPFLRVSHAGGLDAYVRASAAGRYGELALSRHCYVAPTQAAFTCDGRQYACGSHAIRRIMPLGRIAERGVYDSIRAGLAAVEKLPRAEHCYGCALATLYINQSVEARLKERLESMLAGSAGAA